MYFSSFGSRGINETSRKISQYLEKALIGASIKRHFAKCAFIRGESTWNWDTCLESESLMGGYVMASKGI